MARLPLFIALVFVLASAASAQIASTSLCQLLRQGTCQAWCGLGQTRVVTSYNLCVPNYVCCTRTQAEPSTAPPTTTTTTTPTTPTTTSTTPPTTTATTTTTLPPPVWSEWSPCSATCGEGTMRRRCLSPSSSLCEGKEEETMPCPALPPCFTARWTRFEDATWSPCSVTCGKGERTRERFCQTPDGQNSTDCPCFGDYITEQRESCQEIPCPDTECGWRPGEKPWPRVLNGTRSDECSWPWAVSFRLDHPDASVTLCSGVLVSPTHVLTTANCLSVTTLLSEDMNRTVLLGDTNMDSVDNEEKILDIKNVFMHPNFINNGNYSRNNLAVVELRRPVVRTDCNRPVCLLDSLLQPLDISSPRECVVAGFGPTSGNMIPSREMHEAEVTIMPPSSCGAYDLTLPPDHDFVCSFFWGKSRACANDEGSFLACKAPSTGQWVLRGIDVGLPSFGESFDCSPSTPDFYVDVAKHLTWIRSVTGQR